jgi:uncharacterized radical SAM superfamily protein
MIKLNPEDIWQMPKNEFLRLIESGAFRNPKCRIRFYAPSFIPYKNKHFRSSKNVFPSISITGSLCGLKCEHCNGKVLESMVEATTPEKLFEVCKKLKQDGAIGCLISGGCIPDGSVPLDNFLDIIGKIKRDLGFTVIVHTGITDFLAVKRLKNSGVDAVLIDIIGSNETIQKIYHLDLSVDDYEKSLKILNNSMIPFVPHVLVGLHYGKLKGELEALKLISKYSPSAVIIIAFMPIRETSMENVDPTKSEDIARVLVAAKLLMPDIPIVLGCMRPKGKFRIKSDVLAVKAGVDGIAFPVKEAIEMAKSLNFETSFSPFCCSQIFEDLKF